MAVLPSLLIRKVDPALHARLKERAAAHQRSLEEEVRELLRGAVAGQRSDENIVGVAARLFGLKHGVNLPIPPRGSVRERHPPDFAEPDDQR